MKPLNDYVVIELIEEPSKIILTNKPVSPKGKVVGIGTKVKSDIKIGDTIYYRAMAHEYNGLTFVQEDEILGKI